MGVTANVNQDINLTNNEITATKTEDNLCEWVKIGNKQTYKTTDSSDPM